MNLRQGENFCGYSIGKLLGSGTYGKVYAATKGGKKFAIKLFLPGTQPGDKEGFDASTLKEVDALTRLRHPNLVHAVQLFVGQNCNQDETEVHQYAPIVYAILSFKDSALSNLIDKGGLNFPQFLEMSSNILCGMDYMHREMGYMHLDLKPANILVEGKEAFVADFGFAISHVVRKRRKLSTRIVTSWYRPPEICLKMAAKIGEAHYGPEVDMWSIGCILFEMLTDEPLFPGDGRTSEQVNKSVLKKIFTVMPKPRKSYVKKYMHGKTLPRNFFSARSYNGLRNYIERKELDLVIEDKIRQVTNSDVNISKIYEELMRLMEGCLQVNPSERKQAFELLKSPIYGIYTDEFKGILGDFQCNPGEVPEEKFGEVKTNNVYNAKTRHEFFDIIKGYKDSARRLNLDFSLVFLTIDLVDRYNFKKPFRTFVEAKIVLFASFMVAVKLIQPHSLYIESFMPLFTQTLEGYQFPDLKTRIVTAEIDLVKTLKYDLYRNNLYTVCFNDILGPMPNPSLSKIIDAFLDPDNYGRDPKQVCSDIKTGKKGGSKRRELLISPQSDERVYQTV